MTIGTFAPPGCPLGGWPQGDRLPCWLACRLIAAALLLFWASVAAVIAAFV